MPEPVVIIHGYSDKGESFRKWRDVLVRNGFPTEEVAICNYQSLTNEVTIRDIAEGFDRALRTHKAVSDGQPFNAIVHSTGMLVLRSWMATYPGRRARLKRLVALAPATFGSPLAHKGRGFLGAVFKGNKTFGPDFMEAGDMVLDALELGSRFTWELTEGDTLCDDPTFKKGKGSPYAFILCGTESYGGIRQLAREPGTDGTVRLAGCSLNTERIVVDFARDPARKDEMERVGATNQDAGKLLPMPVWLVPGHNHGTIVSDPSEGLQELVVAALRVSDDEGFEKWQRRAEDLTAETRARVEAGEMDEWQQFVVRARDERGDPITDYYVELHPDMDGVGQALDFDIDTHAYGADKSLRCFHVNLSRMRRFLAENGVSKLYLRVIASSGSKLVGYHGVASERMTADGAKMVEGGIWDAKIELPLEFNGGKTTLFYPFTTTLVDLKLNRDPMPFGQIRNDVCGFLEEA